MAFRELLERRVHVHINSGEEFFGKILRQEESIIWFVDVVDFVQMKCYKQEANRVVPFSSIKYMDLEGEDDK